jgi:hypothetical protein
MGSSTNLKIGEVIIPDNTSRAPVWIDKKVEWVNFGVYNRVLKFKKRSFFSKLVLDYELDDQIEIILPNGTIGISLSSYWKSA